MDENTWPLRPSTAPPVEVLILKSYHGLYQLNLLEAEQEDLQAYANLNALFTRTLKPDARPIADSAMVCPVDGRVSAHGKILENTLLQIKNIPYQLEELVGPEISGHYTNGHYVNWYLAPHDYHRFHLPTDATPTYMAYYPGNCIQSRRNDCQNSRAILCQ